jgi:hypothetical protein
MTMGYDWLQRVAGKDVSARNGMFPTLVCERDLRSPARIANPLRRLRTWRNW